MANDLVPNQSQQPYELVDSRGRPLRSAAQILTGEIAAPTVTGIRSIMSDHPAQGLTPQRLAQIMRQAENGDATAYLLLAEEIEEKYLHYQSVLGTRKRAVAQLPINVIAAGDSEEEEADAQIVRDWVDRLTLQGELQDILDAIGKGYSATEIGWELGDLWLPETLKWRLPQFFEFDQLTGEKLLLKGGISGTSGVAEELPPYKFITHFAQAKSGIPIRGGLARGVAWFYLFINFTIKDWITFLEVYGLPLRVGKYQNGTAEADIRKLAQAVAQVGSDAGCVIPASMIIEFIENGGSANPEMFQAFLTYADDQVSKAVTGQTSSADVKSMGMGSGQANLHGEVRGDIRDADAMQVSVTLTRDISKPIVMFNRGVRKRYPIIKVGEPDPVDMDRELKAIDSAVKYRVPVGMKHFRKVTGLPAPEPDEELLQAPAAMAPEGAGEDGTGGSGAKTRVPALSAPSQRPIGAIRGRGKDAVAASSQLDPESGVREPDAIDRLTIDAIGGMDGLSDQLMSGMEDLIASANSMEEVRELVAIRAGDLVAGMDTSALVEMLERSGFAAFVAGMIEKPGR